MSKFVALSLLLFASCKEPNPDFCASDVNCRDAERPFCDVAGEYEESGNTQNTCIPVPANCTIEDCGCTPADTRCVGDALLTCNVDGTAEDESTCPFGCADGACLCEPGAARCDGDQRISCNSDGKGETIETCAMGCSTTTTACRRFEPAFNVAQALAQVVPRDITIPGGSTVFADGMVTTPTGTLDVPSALVTTPAGTMMRVYVARTFTIEAVSVYTTSIQGQLPVSFLATEELRVAGLIDVIPTNADDSTRCNAGVPRAFASGYSSGAGGGGGWTNGGDGGGNSNLTVPAGGSSVGDGFANGCPGGDVLGTSNELLAEGGRGGGAMHLAAFKRIVFLSSSFINVGGAGGQLTGSGGGAGGSVLLEAPEIDFAEAELGIASNGGAGGGCQAGGRGLPALLPALSPKCTTTFNEGGQGGFGATPPAHGEPCPGVGGPCVNQRYGGGGGSVGFIGLGTRNGDLAGTSPILSGQVATYVLTPVD